MNFSLYLNLSTELCTTFVDKQKILNTYVTLFSTYLDTQQFSIKFTNKFYPKKHYPDRVNRFRLTQV